MNRRFASTLGAVLLSLGSLGAVAACTAKIDKPAPAVVGEAPLPNVSGGQGNEGGTDDSGLDSSAGDGGICNDVVLTGVLVDRSGVPTDAPVAAGGTIVDGTYDLTQDNVYIGATGVGGPTGISVKATIRIAGGKIDEHIQIGGTGKTPTDSTSSSVYTVSGSTVSLTTSCSAGGTGPSLNFTSFTAADPILTLLDTSLNEAFTFTKR